MYRKVVIIVNAEKVERDKIIPVSPVTEKMIVAIKQAINLDASLSSQPLKIEIVGAAELWSGAVKYSDDDPEIIYCPLTIQLPDKLNFPAKSIYQACRDLKARHEWIHENLGYKTTKEHSSLGHLWLPVVLTHKGPLYGEMIIEGAIPNSYQQPFDLSDEQRQYLYYLAYRILESISATPAVYLIQCSWHKQEILFDRIWPFPAAPAIGSLGIQQPDLFTCHWHCLTGKPIVDLKIKLKAQL